MPPKSPFLKKGQNVYLASSSRVKGSYDYSRPRPGEFKPRRPIAVAAGVDAAKIWAEADGYRVFLPGKFAQAENPQKTNEELRKDNNISRDSDFQLSRLASLVPRAVIPVLNCPG